MVSKCVKACLVSSALASTMIPGSPHITCGYAKSIHEGKSQKDSREYSRLVSVRRGIVSSQQPNTDKSTVRRRPLGHFRMTAYTRYARSSGRTASGTRPNHARTVAVDPRVIPLGTKLEIEGIGVRIAEDTGRRIKGKKLDVFLSSVQACTRFGVRSRKVYIVD